MLSERRGSFRPQPKQTVAYEVQPSDSLEAIAIRYNITPSELTVLNKLSSRVVFPGQTIFIPEKNSLQTLEEIFKKQIEHIEDENDENDESKETEEVQSSPKPGHVERVPDAPEKALRLNSKYVTDGEGVVSGLLIVTAKHLIFEPNMSDPLVVEYGMEKYGVEAPLDCISRCALLPDIGRSCSTVYRSSIKSSQSQTERLNKPRLPISNSFQENLSRICETEEDRLSDQRRGSGDKRRASIEQRRGSMEQRRGSLKEEEVEKEKKSKGHKLLHKGLKRLSLTTDLFSTAPSGRRMSLPVFAADDAKKALDKLIPRPAESFCDTPLYLCLRMDQDQEVTHSVIHFAHQIKPEYWFTVPKDSVDDLYFFFLRWCPEKYGEMENMGTLGPPEEPEQQTSTVPAIRRASWAFPWRRKSKDAISPIEGWEFLDLVHKQEVLPPPELLQPSKILEEEQLLEIQKYLPARAMNPWELIYSTAVHGFGLKTMYRAMKKYDSPVLIVIVSRSDAVFGALLSSPLRMSDHFYGTGESFVFTFHPEFKVFGWSGVNDYFAKGNTTSFVVGSSEGHFGLWLDDDLFRGRTHECETFNNGPLCPEGDFEVKSLEAWGFP